MANNYRYLLLFTALFVSQAILAEDKVCILNGLTEETAAYHNLFANDQGMFKKNNLKLEVLYKNTRKDKTVTLDHRIESKKHPRAMIPSKSNCDFVVLSFEKVIAQDQAILNDYKVLYSSYYGINYDTHFIVKKGSKVKTLQDLANQNIRLGQLGTMLAFKNMMAMENVPTKSIKLLELDSVKVLDGLKNNQIAMGSTYFPTMQVALASGEVEILRKNIFATYLQNPYPQSIILVKKSTLQSKPETVKKYKEMMSAVLKITAKNPMVLAQTLKTHSKELGMAAWTATDAQIEKGEEQYSDINLISENDSLSYKNAATTPREIFIKTLGAFKEAHFLKNDVDLNTLF